MCLMCRFSRPVFPETAAPLRFLGVEIIKQE